MAIPTTYTGQNSGAAPIYQGGKTEAALGQGIQDLLGAKRQDVAYAKQEEQSFLKSMEIDPITVANKQAMDNQVQLLEEFQSKWAGIYKDRGGRLNVEDKAALRADQMAIKARQGTVQASYDRYLRDVASFDPSQHDRRDFIERSAQYLDSGEMPPEGLLTPAAVPYDEYIKDLNQYARGTTKGIDESPYFSEPVQVGDSIVYKPRLTEEQAYKRHENFVLGDPTGRRLKTITQAWGEIGETEKKEILDAVDVNNNGKYEDDELRNAYVEADFRRNRDHYLAPVVKRRSVPYWEHREQQGTPSSTRAQAIATGIGEATSGARFTDQPQGVSSKYIGDSESGIVFDYSGVTSPNRGWLSLPTNAIKEAPENMSKDVTRVEARPQVAANGKVEWVAKIPINVPTTITEYRMADADEKKYFKEEDGKWYYIDYQEKTVATDYSTVSGIIDNAFSDFSSVYEDRGYATGGSKGKYDKYKKK
jgi:hypothetical protein